MDQSAADKKYEPIHPWRWRLLSVWIILFTALVIYSLHQQDNLSKANTDRIADTRNESINRDAAIQASRAKSCRQSLENIRQLFKPFSVPKAVRTPKQQKDLDTFNNGIKALKAKCAEQVKTHPPVRKGKE